MMVFTKKSSSSTRYVFDFVFILIGSYICCFTSYSLYCNSNRTWECGWDYQNRLIAVSTYVDCIVNKDFGLELGESRKVFETQKLHDSQKSWRIADQRSQQETSTYQRRG